MMTIPDWAVVNTVYRVSSPTPSSDSPATPDEQEPSFVGFWTHVRQIPRVWHMVHPQVIIHHQVLLHRRLAVEEIGKVDQGVRRVVRVPRADRFQLVVRLTEDVVGVGCEI